MVTKFADKNGGQPAKKPETVKMRTLSFVLAFILAGPTLAGPADSHSSPIVTAAPSIVVATR